MGEVVPLGEIRSCAHCGCGWPAASTLSFDYDSRRTWLEDLTSRASPATYDLCSVHAGRFRAPRGWRHDDLRRMPEPLIEGPPAEDLPDPKFDTLEEIVLPEI